MSFDVDMTPPLDGIVTVARLITSASRFFRDSSEILQRFFRDSSNEVVTVIEIYVGIVAYQLYKNDGRICASSGALPPSEFRNSGRGLSG